MATPNIPLWEVFIRARAGSDPASVVFDALVENNPEIRKYLKLHSRHRSLQNFFQLYRPFARLPPDALALLLDELEPVTAEKGQRIIRQGEHFGPLYVLEEGRVRVYTEEDGHRSYVAYLRKGDVFGEISVFRRVPRSATVEAVPTSTTSTRFANHASTQCAWARGASIAMTMRPGW